MTTTAGAVTAFSTMQAGGGRLDESIMGGGASGGRGLMMTETVARHVLAAVTGRMGYKQVRFSSFYSYDAHKLPLPL
jgi:hypothetical protein